MNLKVIEIVVLAPLDPAGRNLHRVVGARASGHLLSRLGLKLDRVQLLVFDHRQRSRLADREIHSANREDQSRKIVSLARYFQGAAPGQLHGTFILIDGDR